MDKILAREVSSVILDFGREVCSNLGVSRNREWLVTNGIGGFASGTVAGMLTRRYHGLLMAALTPPLGRTLLVVKLDETVEYGGIYPESGRYYPLFTNHWADDTIEPNGYDHMDRFYLEGTTPVWCYSFANALLEKRIWMEPGANTTYVNYRLVRATGPLKFSSRVLADYRDYHATSVMDDDWEIEVTSVTQGLRSQGLRSHGLRVQMQETAVPFYLLSQQITMEPQEDWYEDYYLSVEEYRGQNDIQEDHVNVARLQAILRPGESMTLVATTEADADLDGDAAYARRQAHEAALLEQAQHRFQIALPIAVRQLVLAADQFVVHRATASNPNGRSIIAGYPWFSDWGRDTMIALPGLTLTTGRPEIAATILRTYAQFVDQGMIPNRFPDVGEKPEYNTVDATLWYFQAIYAYYQETQDKTLLTDLFPALQDVMKWHMRGTRYNIYMDEQDGLLFAGEEGVQLTWMDAKIDDWVVTSRIGKPVEINALWYNALHIMAFVARELGEDDALYTAVATKAHTGFARFWNNEMGYCYDVIDGPNGLEGSLRPNQLLAISLPHSPLTPEQQRSVVDACGRHLLTPHGLRSLSPDDDQYIGHYGGDRYKRDGAYHQGTTWGWLIGPFVSAHLRVYQNPALAQTYLDALWRHLADAGVGSVSEIFDGDPPFTPRGCIAQAWSVAECLRAWAEIENAKHRA